MNIETASQVAGPDQQSAADSQVLPDFNNLRVEKAALITCPQGKQHVALVGPDWYAEIKRQANGAKQPYLNVSFHQGHRELTETSDMQVVRFPKLEGSSIFGAQIQHIDAVPTVVLILADDYRVLFSAGVADESIGVEFADPNAAVA